MTLQIWWWISLLPWITAPTFLIQIEEAKYIKSDLFYYSANMKHDLMMVHRMWTNPWYIYSLADYKVDNFDFLCKLLLPLFAHFFRQSHSSSCSKLIWWNAHICFSRDWFQNLGTLEIFLMPFIWSALNLGNSAQSTSM